MTFYLESRFRKNFFLKDGSDPYAVPDTARVYWVFSFANEDIEKIEGSHTGRLMAFDIPDGFFSEERLGVLTHQLLIRDEDEFPTIFSIPISDKLIRGGPTIAQLFPDEV